MGGGCPLALIACRLSPKLSLGRDHWTHRGRKTGGDSREAEMQPSGSWPGRYRPRKSQRRWTCTAAGRGSSAGTSHFAARQPGPPHGQLSTAAHDDAGPLPTSPTHPPFNTPYRAEPGGAALADRMMGLMRPQAGGHGHLSRATTRHDAAAVRPSTRTCSYSYSYAVLSASCLGGPPRRKYDFMRQLAVITATLARGPQARGGADKTCVCRALGPPSARIASQSCKGSPCPGVLRGRGRLEHAAVPVRDRCRSRVKSAGWLA